MRTLATLLLMAILAASCRKAPRDSPEFQAAFALYTQLYSAGLDEAYDDARMQEVLELLRTVDSSSARAAEAGELRERIERAIDERRSRAERLEAALEASDTPVDSREADGGPAPEQVTHGSARDQAHHPPSPGPVAAAQAATASPAPEASIDAAGRDGTVRVKAENETVDADVIPLVTAAARGAISQASRWGPLRHDTVIDIISNRDSLQIRAHFEGAEWVDAVAAYDVVYLLSPHAMAGQGSLPSGARLTRLLAHELTHCVLQQATGTVQNYRSRRIPFWFNEGMATNAAGEGAQLSRAELATTLSRRPAIDPLHTGGWLAHGEPALAYSSAYWAFQLLEQQGTAPIQQLLLAMHAGSAFPDAFGLAYGEPEAALEDRLLRALRHNQPPR